VAPKVQDSDMWPTAEHKGGGVCRDVAAQDSRHLVCGRAEASHRRTREKKTDKWASVERAMTDRWVNNGRVAHTAVTRPG
jgi:hypothetical protein